MVAAMIAGTVLVVVAGARSPTTQRAPPQPPPPEVPWLTPEAAAQVVAPGGGLGPLFEGVELGGPAPSPAQRARIAAFARDHRVAIELEVDDGELAAVRFAVTFGGCCGYEGADVLALRLGRPDTERCCGCESTWIDDWALTLDGGVRMRGRVRVNRVDVRWEPALELPELLDRADRLLGMHVASVRDAAGDRWSELEPGRRYQLEVAYPFVDATWFVNPGMEHRADLGLHLTAERGRIVEVTLSLRDRDDDRARVLVATMRSRWGRSRVASGAWTWLLSDRVVTAALHAPITRIAIRAR
jgi:hypothetical protein